MRRHGAAATGAPGICAADGQAFCVCGVGHVHMAKLCHRAAARVLCGARLVINADLQEGQWVWVWVGVCGCAFNAGGLFETKITAQ